MKLGDPAERRIAYQRELRAAKVEPGKTGMKLRGLSLPSLEEYRLKGEVEEWLVTMPHREFPKPERTVEEFWETVAEIEIERD